MDRETVVSTLVWAVLVGLPVAYVGVVLYAGATVTFFGLAIYAMVVAVLAGLGVVPKPPRTGSGDRDGD